jgi:uncharacterized membrane protein YeaQ/YmgE (transglycosylase-associated protein family)
MNHCLAPRRILAPTILALVLGLSILAAFARLHAAESVSDQVGAATADAEKKIQDASQTAQTKIEQIWRRIDEQRLKNRTRDQLVAWVIMGLLVAGLIRQFTKLNQATALVLGLVGSFLGGIVANVTQVDLGLGPVLIRYEDLLASLLGATLVMITARWLAARREAKK